MLKCYPPGTRKGNRWCVIKGRAAGRQIERTLYGILDEEEARAIAAEYVAELEGAAARVVDPRAPQTFRELAHRYAGDRRISRHERARVDRLVAARIESRCQVLGDIPLDEIVPATGREAAIALYGHRSSATMNRSGISPFSAVVHFAAENQWMPYLRIKPFRQVKRVTPRLDYGEDDVQRILAAARKEKPKKCDRYKRDHPYRLILLLFLFRQGWRISETLRLTWAQVDMQAGKFRLVLVDKGAEEKTTLPIHPDVYEALAGLPAGEPERVAQERRGRVFPWVDRHNVYRWLKPWCAEIGIHFRPHMARVEYASQLNDADQTPASIMGSCTWTDTKAIERYIRTDERKAARANALAGRRL